MRIDGMIREESGTEFVVPEKLEKLPGKLIYLSMGSMGSADVPLMERLVELLQDAPHRFIISTGMLGDDYKLADNMWGEKMLPQIKVLEKVDLVSECCK